MTFELQSNLALSLINLVTYYRPEIRLQGKINCATFHGFGEDNMVDFETLIQV